MESFNCRLILELTGMSADGDLNKILDNYEVILKHKDAIKNKCYWPYGESPSMRELKITNIKKIQVIKND